MSKSKFQRYWNNIDNSPGTLDYASKEQLAEVKRMVKAAFHAGHSQYYKRIEELEAKLNRVEALRDYIQTSGNRAVYCAAQQMAGSATASFYKNLLKRLEKALEENEDE